VTEGKKYPDFNPQFDENPIKELDIKKFDLECCEMLANQGPPFGTGWTWYALPGDVTIFNDKLFLA
jgi:hypothetical protein